MFQTGNRGLTLQFIQLFSLCKKHHDHCSRFREEYVGFPKQFYLFFLCTSSIEEITKVVSSVWGKIIYSIPCRASFFAWDDFE